MRSKRLLKRTRNRQVIRNAITSGRLVVTLKKKKDIAIDRALSRGDEETASDVVATTGVVKDAVKLARDLKAAGDEDVEDHIVTALADCVTAMDTDKSPFEVEEETSKVKQNQERYLIVSALQGRRGRSRHGRDIIVDGETTVAIRENANKLARATRAGKRVPRYPSSATEPTHALALRAEHIKKQRAFRRCSQRVSRALKANPVATPKDCTLAQTIRDDGVPLFITQPDLVPKGRDNKPLIAAEAAARAVRHRAEKGRKTLAEIEEDRRTRLPDKVRASEAKSRAGQYFVTFCISKSYSAAIRRKFKGAFSVVKPGTDGYYASTKAAVEVRDEWIELQRPESWMAKGGN
jgi:hypothetical protein